MEAKDVKVGMKVVPHDKTVQSSFGKWATNNPRHKKFLDEHGFLIVEDWRQGREPFALYDGVDQETGNTVFNASDFSPATIEVGDTVRVITDEHIGGFDVGTEAVVTDFPAFYSSKIASIRNGACNLHHSIHTLDLVRKAKRVPNSEIAAPADRRPTVGDWVEVVATDHHALRKGDVAKIVKDDVAIDNTYLVARACGKTNWILSHRVKLTTPPEQKPREFKVWDRVEHSRYGDGTVIGYHKDSGNPCVEFDRRDLDLHDGKGYGASGADGRCWYCAPVFLKHIPAPATVLKSDADAAVRRAFIAGQEQIGKGSVKVDYTIDYNPSAETLAKFFEADA